MRRHRTRWLAPGRPRPEPRADCVPNEPVSGGRERRDVPRRDKESGTAVLDELGEATYSKCDGRNAERHGVYDGGAEALRARRVEHDIEASHCRMDLVDEPSAKRREPADRLATSGLTAEEHEANALAGFLAAGGRRSPRVSRGPFRPSLRRRSRRPPSRAASGIRAANRVPS